MTSSNPLHKARHLIPVAGLSLLLLSAGMCRQADRSSPDETTAAAGSEELANLARDQQQALAAARAQAAAEAKAAEQKRQDEIAAAEQELAAREARLAEEEERLRQQQALQAEKERLAAERAAAAERERQLAAREQELREKEAELALREKETPSEETIVAESAAPEPLPEPTGNYEGNYDEPWRESQEAASDEADNSPAEESVLIEADPAPPTAQASLEPGELLEVQIRNTLSSETSRVGDTFSTRLVGDLYDSAGTLVIPAGAEVLGRVTEASPFRRGGGPATLGVEFTHIVVSPDQTVGIRASFSELGADQRKNRKKVAAGAIAGAILGHILGGDGSKNVIIGAAAGAAAGGAIVARAKDKDAEIPAGQIIPLRLEEVVTVEIDYGAVADS
jgi:Skp family chaperone for outer membrane proteins